MNILQQRTTVLLLAACACVACQKQESPSQVQQDVAKEQAKAQEDVAKAQEKAASSTDPKAQYDVAMAKIEGDYKVAMERCDGQPPDQQSACKDAAKADRDRAEAMAKQQNPGQ